MEEAADMHSLLMTDNNTLLMGGLQNYVVEVDLNTVQETQKVRHWDYICIIYAHVTRPCTSPISCVLHSSLLRYLGWQ